jgi:NADPH:quinone reductase-like Zn-dependent oxidoreductase
MMKAVYLTSWAALNTVPETVSFGDVPAPPPPKKDEVLISVKAASINTDDIPLLQDSACGGWLFHTRKPTTSDPLVGGMDYSGIVLAVGPDCKRVKVGDRVCGISKIAEYQRGTWAEQTLYPESDVCLISSADISFVDAAAVAMGAFVDFDMISHAAKVLPTQSRCLVVGASGALGTVMLQMLQKYESCHVTAVCSGKNAETCLSMGANATVDYTKGPFGEQLQDAEQFDVVFDFVGGPDVLRNSEPLLKKNGLFVTAVGDRQNLGDRILTFSEFASSAGFMVRRSLCGCGGAYKYVMSGGYPPLTEQIWKESALAGARAAIAEEVPFAEEPIRAALRRVASHHPGGRVVINLERSV